MCVISINLTCFQHGTLPLSLTQKTTRRKRQALSRDYASLGGAAWSTNLNWLSPDLDCKTCKQAAPAERWKDRP